MTLSPLPSFDLGMLPERELLYELKKIAHARLSGHSALTQLNTTALVNESYLRWGDTGGAQKFSSAGHFYAYVSKVMRSVIVDMVRERLALKRGGSLERVTLDTAISDGVQAAEPLQVDEALMALERVEPRLARVVEMRYFVGLSEADIADVLGLTERTVRRDWCKARVLLKTMLQ
jgi:RNA polymerase sigma factor (TIGR02999 family)